MPGVADATTVWRHTEGTLSRSTPRSVIVLPASRSEPLVLEGAAAIVWRALCEPASDQQLVARIARAVGHEAGEVGDEVRATCAALADAGVIVGTR
jgi:hypothetical protein